jgi:cellulose synthase/poly-beta-1,6-N-acetylglucosamine synthase-like glycosyltransferase
MNPASPPKSDLKLLSVVIPARNEEGCIAATLEHLHLELNLQKIPHEIVVVDDGSRDGTAALCARVLDRGTAKRTAAAVFISALSTSVSGERFFRALEGPRTKHHAAIEFTLAGFPSFGICRRVSASVQIFSYRS